MSTSVNYKGNTITTISNATRTLNTAGTWLEANITITDTSSGGGITIEDSNNATGVTCVITGSELPTIEPLNVTVNGTYTASGSTGGYSPVTVNVSGGGGSTPSATQHTIVFTFSDNTNTTITAYWDDAFISSAITATTPATYGSKTVTLAQLDGVTWYEPSNIPIGVELIDFTAVTNHYIINASGVEESYPGTSVSDYTLIDPTMTFTFKGYQWFYVGFYDSSKTPISTLYIDQVKDSATGEIATGTLNSTNIPANAMYVRIDSLSSPTSSTMSLIRAT